MKAFKINPAANALMAASSATMAQDLGLEISTQSEMYFQDANDDGLVDFIPLVQTGSDGTFIITNGQLNIRNFCMGWMERVVTSQLPASHFMKTQYTIEQVDIATLENRPQQLFQCPS